MPWLRICRKRSRIDSVKCEISRRPDGGDNDARWQNFHGKERRPSGIKSGQPGKAPAAAGKSDNGELLSRLRTERIHQLNSKGAVKPGRPRTDHTAEMAAVGSAANFGRQGTVCLLNKLSRLEYRINSERERTAIGERRLQLVNHPLRCTSPKMPRVFVNGSAFQTGDAQRG